MRPLKLGFIGPGKMAPMVGQLVAAGHSLFAHTRCAMRAMQQALQDAAAVACTNATEVAQQADTTFLMLPDTPEVATVLFGEGRVAAGLQAGRTVVDRSSLSPIETRQFAQRIDALGCQCLDAPVSGGEVGAKAASLTIMVGGPQAACAAASVATDGQEHHAGGGNGDDQTTKVANQIWHCRRAPARPS